MRHCLQRELLNREAEPFILDW